MDPQTQIIQQPVQQNLPEGKIHAMPRAMILFSFLMYVGAFLSIVGPPMMLKMLDSGFYSSRTNDQALFLSALVIVPFAVGKLVLVHFFLRKRSNVIRILLLGWVCLDMIIVMANSLGSAGSFMAPMFIPFLAPLVQLISLFFLFSASSREWFITGFSSTSELSRRYWYKIIPKTNIVFLVLSCILVFGLDLLILLSSPMLFPFWIEMLVAFGVFMGFFYAECYTFRSKFSQSYSSVDIPLYCLIVLRNFVLFLNFIPLIQIIGAILSAVGILPYLIVYVILIRIRNKETMVAPVAIPQPQP